MEDPTPPLQFLGAIIPHVTRKYPFDGPPRTYSIFFSLLLGPPSQQGEPGDFFVGELDVYIKSEQGPWRKAYFHLPEYHPLADDDDIFQDLHLFHDALGPCWTQSQLSPRIQRWPSWFRSVPVTVQFYRALARHKRLPGSTSDNPIHIED